MTRKPRTLSARARQLLLSPQFLTEKKTTDDFFWETSTSLPAAPWSADKILTLRYSCPQSDPFAQIFCETLAVIAPGKSFSALAKLSFREAESFLRDANHVAAFDQDDEAHARESFQKILNHFVAFTLFEKLHSNLAGMTIAWDKSSLAGKNRLASQVLSLLSGQLAPGPVPELIWADSTSLTLRKNDCGLEMGVLEELFQRIFPGEGRPDPLKVIGTS